MKKEFAILLIIILIIYLTKKKMDKLKFPVDVAFRITSKYGNRINPVTKQKQFHNGVDLAVPSNTKIFASEDGKVLKSYFNDLGGRQLIVRFDNGFYMGFAHLNKNDFFSVGQSFKKNDLIALSGNTGQSTGSHIHLTMKNEKGVNVDPLKYLTT